MKVLLIVLAMVSCSPAKISDLGIVQREEDLSRADHLDPTVEDLSQPVTKQFAPMEDLERLAAYVRDVFGGTTPADVIPRAWGSVSWNGLAATVKRGVNIYSSNRMKTGVFSVVLSTNKNTPGEWSVSAIAANNSQAITMTHDQSNANGHDVITLYFWNSVGAPIDPPLFCLTVYQ